MNSYDPGICAMTRVKLKTIAYRLVCKTHLPLFCKVTGRIYYIKRFFKAAFRIPISTIIVSIIVLLFRMEYEWVCIYF